MCYPVCEMVHIKEPICLLRIPVGLLVRASAGGPPPPPLFFPVPDGGTGELPVPATGVRFNSLL